jgi:UrcA family protein
MTTANSKLTSFYRSLLLGGFIAASGMATPLLAASPADALSVSVKYSDLDLSSANGVDRLYRRIESAAREVCPDIYSRDLGIASAGRHCEAEAISAAVSRVNNAKLALVHASRVSRS